LVRRFKNQRVPKEFMDQLNIYKIKKNVKTTDIYSIMSKEWNKTQVFLDDILGVRRK